MNESEIMHLVRQRQRNIEEFVFLKLLPKAFSHSVSHTRHFKEWYELPMNYVRIMELPLTFELLDAEKEHKILDISSPKLLSLYMSINGYRNLTISDIEDYFVEDFKRYSEEFSLAPDIAVFDAKTIPYQTNTFDRAFSVSVLEHVPHQGDVNILKEVARVLKPGGIFICTLPAYKIYLEEWIKNNFIYWETHTNAEGAKFYQRRYDDASIDQRFANLGLDIKEIIYIAEHPIKEPEVNENGMLMHNIYYLEELKLTKLLKKISKKLQKKVPILPYLAHRHCSQRYQYLTKDSKDPNIRQVAIKLQK
jgi:ubiquinone/menaquinone biosynthesis C-methylase UbiE